MGVGLVGGVGGGVGLGGGGVDGGVVGGGGDGGVVGGGDVVVVVIVAITPRNIIINRLVTRCLQLRQFTALCDDFLIFERLLVFELDCVVGFKLVIAVIGVVAITSIRDDILEYLFLNSQLFALGR